MMSLEELNASAVEAEVVDGEPETEQEQVDMNDALELLGATVHLLNYLGNPVLETSVTKREKLSMFKLSKKIVEYLAEVSPSYMVIGRG